MHLEYTAWVKGGLCHRILQNTYYISPYYEDTESKQLYQIHRNKHRKAAQTRRQENMAHMKEQIKTPEKEMEISNLSAAALKTLVIRMLKELSEDLNDIKKIQSEKKNTLTEIKDSVQGNNGRVDEAKKQINDLEHKEGKNNQEEQQ